MSEARSLVLALALTAAAVGCDSRATGHSAPGPSNERNASEYETCSATRDCQQPLRCRAGICRNPSSSVAGEIRAAAGRLAIREQRFEDAIAAYSDAGKAFDAAKIPIPAEVHCGHGEALVRAGGDPQRFELAARVLHRCLMAAPVGVELRQRALGLLAELHTLGLDIELLGRDKLADRYMTGQPPAPPTEDLVLSVTPSQEVRSHTFTKWMDRVRSDEVRNALVPCWREHFAATRDAAMTVTLPMRHSFKLDQYGDFDRTTIEVSGLEPTGNAATDAARECAKSAIEPIADDHTKGREDERRWDVELTFSLQPAS